MNYTDVDYAFNNQNFMINDGYKENDEKFAEDVIKEIERGTILYQERQLAKKNVEYEIKSKKTKKKKSPFTINKYYCSDTGILKIKCPKECKHYGNPIINRNILTPKEHLNFLAKPKYITNQNYSSQFYPTKQQNCYYRKKYSYRAGAATTRIEQLSIPSKKNIINTWIKYGNMFSARQISNLANMLMESKYTSIEKAICNIREDKKLRKLNKLRCSREIEKIKRKIEILKIEHIQEILYGLADVLKDFLMDETEQIDSQKLLELQPLTIVILRNIAKLLSKNEILLKFYKLKKFSKDIFLL